MHWPTPSPTMFCKTGSLIRRHRAVLLMVIATVILMAVIIVGTLFYTEGTFASSLSIESIKKQDSPRGVILLADIFALDTVAKTISVRWSVVGACSRDYIFAGEAGCALNALALPMNLYLNENASTNWNVTNPSLQYDPYTLRTPPPTHYITARSSLPVTFAETILPMDPFLPYNGRKELVTSTYPFEGFNSYVSLLAINPNNNSTLDIVDVLGDATVINWVGSAEFGQAPSLPGGNVPQYFVTLTISRHATIKATVMVTFVTNWLLTLAVVWMTILVWLGRSIDTGLILASTSILFALPQIRAGMPDAPPFSTFLDTIGYVANLCVVSACTFILLLFSLAPYVHDSSTPFVQEPRPLETTEESTPHIPGVSGNDT